MKGVVYKIICLENPDIIYIGSTTETLCKRMARHRAHYKDWLNGKGGCVSIYPFFKEIGLEKFKIFEIQRFEVEDKQQLRGIEQDWIEKTDCVNKVRAYSSEEYKIEKRKKYIERNKGKIKNYFKEYHIKNIRTIKQKDKDYYEQNKDIILEKNKDYREKNKEKINKNRSEKINCSQCDKQMRKDSITRHLKICKNKEIKDISN